MRSRRIFLNLTQSIYGEPEPNITVKGETLGAFLLRSGTGKDVLPSTPIQ